MGKWSEKSLSEKIATVLMLITCCGVLVFAALEIFNVYEGASDVMIPLLGVDMLLSAYLERRTRKSVSIVSLIAAAVIFICFACVLILNALPTA
jgi:TRAP-type C4-dicarboxylate transport system permease small subunit